MGLRCLSSSLSALSTGIILCIPSVVSAAGLFNFTQCAVDINATFTGAFNESVLVDSSGSFTDNPDDAWGITYGACMTLCGSGRESFDWYFFSTSISSWVLPWLALTAQLPYETKDGPTNLLSVVMAIGSPMLITYSLCLTILNSRWINLRFRALCDRNQEVLGKQIETMDSARVFLRECQHVPLEISGSPSIIAQLVASPENRAWWYSLRKEVLKSKREWTYSLLAQVIWVCIAVISAVSDFFDATADNTMMGIGVAINSLWIWMIPITLGFVWVGTQTSSSTIREALMVAEASVSEKDSSGVYRPVEPVANRMLGFRDRTGDVYVSTWPDIEDNHCMRGKLSLPRTFCGISVAGFEMEPGPVFNYARAWSHRHTAQTIIDAFEALNARLQARQRVHERENGWNDRKWKDNLRGTAEEMEAYIYPSNYQEPSRDLRITWDYLVAAFISVVLLWGTTGAAILTAYNTPVIGLGCDSGSYLLYGSVATVSWGFLVLSAYLSHRCNSDTPSNPSSESINITEPSDMEGNSLLSAETITGFPSTLNPQSPLTHRRAQSSFSCLPSVLLLLIILTRYLGVLLSAINAIWLLLISFLQFTNVYNNCWCEGCVLGLGNKAWVILWASDEQTVAAAWNSWIFALIMSSVAVLIAGGFFVTMGGEELFKRR